MTDENVKVVSLEILGGLPQFSRLNWSEIREDPEFARHFIALCPDDDGNPKKSPGSVWNEHVTASRPQDVVAYKRWQKRTSEEYPADLDERMRDTLERELEAFEKLGDWGFGFVLTDGYVAVDLDCDHKDMSGEILKAFCKLCPGAPIRCRGGFRWASIVRLSSKVTPKKVVFKLDADGEKSQQLEILGAGQQLAVAGRHVSGTRYAWCGAEFTPANIPTVEDDDFNSFVNEVREKFGKKRGRPAAPVERVDWDGTVEGLTVSGVDFDIAMRQCLLKTDAVAAHLRNHPNFISADDDKIYLRCPNEDKHTTHNGPKDLAFFKDTGVFKCFHASCSEMSQSDWRAAFGISESLLDEDKAPTLYRLRSYASVKRGPKRPAQFVGFQDDEEALSIALSDPAFCGIELGYDTFKYEYTWRKAGSKEWLNERARGGIEAIKVEVMRALNRVWFRRLRQNSVASVLKAVAKSNSYNSFKLFWDKNKREWDRRPRMLQAGRDALKVPHKDGYLYSDDWLEGMMLYTFTSALSRALSDKPVKADIVPVFIGQQGAGKSTLVKAMALSPEYFTDGVSWDDKDDNMTRIMRGKMICELAECAGMNVRDRNDVKRFVTRTTETIVRKYEEGASEELRRCVFCMTTNETNILRDVTGERRWGIIPVGEAIDIAWFEENIWQLYAEAEQWMIDHNGETAWAVVDAMNRDKALAADRAEFESRPLGQDTLEEYLATGTYCQIDDVSRVLEEKKIHVKSSVLLSDMLKRAGWRSTKLRIGGAQRRYWVSPNYNEENAAPCFSIAGGEFKFESPRNDGSSSKLDVIVNF